MLSKTAETLRRLRASQGMTRTDFAKHIGVPFYSYRSWEQSIRNLSLENIITICDALNIPYDVLLLPRITDIKQTAKTA